MICWYTVFNLTAAQITNVDYTQSNLDKNAITEYSRPLTTSYAFQHRDTESFKMLIPHTCSCNNDFI